VKRQLPSVEKENTDGKKEEGEWGPDRKRKSRDKKNVPLLEPKILQRTLWELRLHRCSVITL